MIDASGAGFFPPPPPAPPMGPPPGYGHVPAFHERLQSAIGRQITVYVGEMTAPVRGVLHAVGSNYVEVHRTINSTMEAVLIPIHAINAII